MELKTNIACKKSDNKAFKAGDGNWYNLNDNVISVLAAMAKGDEVVITYEQKGTSRYVSKMVKPGTVQEHSQSDINKEQSTTGFTCEDCGAVLKNDKYKKCFVCNKKSDKGSGEKPNYNNPEKTAQIQRGNALNAAAATVSGITLPDAETTVQFVITTADRYLNWLRNE